MSDEFQRIEVITGTARRHRWTVAEKPCRVEARLQPGRSVSDVARQHGVAPNLLFRSRKLMREGGGEAMPGDGPVVGPDERRRRTVAASGGGWRSGSASSSGSSAARRSRAMEPRDPTLKGPRPEGRGGEVGLLKEALAKTGAKQPTWLTSSSLPGSSRL